MMHWLLRSQNFKRNKAPGPHFLPNLSVKPAGGEDGSGLSAMQIHPHRCQVQRGSEVGRWKEEIESAVWTLLAYFLHYNVIVMCLVIALIQAFKNADSFFNWPKHINDVYWVRQGATAIKSTGPGATLFLSLQFTGTVTLESCINISAPQFLICKWG